MRLRALPTRIGCWLLCCVLQAGCVRPYFISEMEYTYHNTLAPHDAGNANPIEQLSAASPRTAIDPEAAEKWELTLAEAKRIGLENNKQIKVAGYLRDDQTGQFWSAELESRLAAFDAFLEVGGGWQRVDRQVTSNIQNNTQDLFGSPIGNGSFGFNATSGAGSDTDAFPPAIRNPHLFSIGKRNGTGGETLFGYSLDYERVAPPTSFTATNPYWRSSLGLQIQQPLLQGAGVEFNRAPILIARANNEEQIRVFERAVHDLLFQIEQSYWQLHFAYQDLYSREVGLRHALATWQRQKELFQEGEGTRPDQAQTREQYQFFRAQVYLAKNRVLTAEQELRERMGLPPDDGKQIVVADTPGHARYTPNWDAAVREAMDLRPELIGQRFAIRAAELELLRQQNGLLPDLTLTSTYTITGLDNQFDQSIDRLTDNQYSDWYLGIRFRRPIGERAANSAVRRSQMVLSQQRAGLRNLEHSIITDLHEAFQNIDASYALILSQIERRTAAADQLDAMQEYHRVGQVALHVLLEAQSQFADALRDEAQAVVQYNQSLAQWERAKGTILQNDNVVIVEDIINHSTAGLSEKRYRQWQRSIPIPIHPGSAVRGAIHDEEPDEALYPAIAPEKAALTPP